MAHDQPQAAGPTKLVIRNIGLLLSAPWRSDSGRRLQSLRRTARSRNRPRHGYRCRGATTIIDANGTTVVPGLIDSHVHPVPVTGRRAKSDRLDRQLSAWRRHHHDFSGEFICPAAP